MVADKLITIVTICYNDVEGLRRTVESINRQTYGLWEHIIVDGASSDGTLEYVESLPHDERRRFVSGRDQGIYDAMNKGVGLANGGLVIFVNSGDALSESDSLRTYAESHSETQWRWAYGAVRFLSREGDRLGAYTFDPFNRYKFLMGLSWIPFASVCFERDLLKQVGEFRTDLGTSADQELLMRALSVDAPFVIGWFTADYERGGVSQSVGPREREMTWHRMRGETGNWWLGKRYADRVVSEAMALRKPFRILAKKVGSR